MKINLSGPDITQAEIDAVTAVLKTRTLSLGPKLVEFETAFCDYIGRKYAVAVNSGTSALHLAMLAYEIGPGDEVITTPFSFVATTNCILMVGATPVFVDIDPATYNIRPDLIESKITTKTKALLPVEVFGNPLGLDKVAEIAKKHHLICVEDSCEGLGSKLHGRKVGTLGDMSTFAFYPNKQMTTGEGGMLLTDDERAAAICASLRNQGRDPNAGWLAHARLGYNYRLCDINCALGIEQLKRLDEFIVKRRRVAGWYNEMLGKDSRLVLPVEPAGCDNSWFVYVVRLQDDFSGKDRDNILAYLREHGIGCNNYFSPIHLQPYVARQFGFKKGDFPVTERIAERTIALPFYNHLTQHEVEIVCAAMTMALNKIKS
jgi:perosamine synthetase